MSDGLFSGLLGGPFGPATAHWISRFKYWAIFLVAMLLTNVLFVVYMPKDWGSRQGENRSSNGYTCEVAGEVVIRPIDVSERSGCQSCVRGVGTSVLNSLAVGLFRFRSPVPTS